MIGGGFGGFGGYFYDPYAYPYYAYGYPPSYAYGWYPPPPPDEGPAEAPPPPPGEAPVPPPDASGADTLNVPDDAGTYGLVRFLEVPDGATLSLDGRYWLEAHDLDGHWLPLPAGTLTIGIRASGYAPTELQVDVVAGRQQDVRLGPPA